MEPEIIDITSFNINYNNQDFKIELGKKGKNILFKIQILSKINDYNFKSYFSLDDLIEINKIFRKCDTIDEAFKDLNDILNKGNTTIELKSGFANLHLSINYLDKNLVSIFRLKKEKLSEKEANEILISEMNQTKLLLKKEKLKNEELVTEIKKLNKKIEDLKTDVENLKNWKNNFEKKTIRKNINLNSDNINSKIILKEEVAFLSNRFIKNKFLKKKKVYFTLIYRASRDGDEPETYHKHCDLKSNTLCVIKTEEECRFGGYTEIKIDNDIYDSCDKDAFLFSLNKMKIYENMIKDANVISYSKTWGPIFIGGFTIADKKFFSPPKDTCDQVKEKKNSPFFQNLDIDYEINNGKKYFSIKELEVFQMTFE